MRAFSITLATDAALASDKPATIPAIPATSPVAKPVADTSKPALAALASAATHVGATVPNVSKPAPRKPASKPTVGNLDASGKPSKPVASKPTSKPATVAPVADAEPAVKLIGTARTAHTIAANATSFGGVLSDRDQAYLAFYASFAGADRTKRVTVSDIANAGRRPAYNGSNKPHDAGVINRLRKAGLLSVAGDGTSFSFTKLGREMRVA